VRDHVIICGYGRIGQSVAHFLEEEHIRYVALDMDPARVKTARLAGDSVFFGDASDRAVLDAVGVGSARLALITHADVPAAQRILHHIRAVRPDLPVMVRTRDEQHVEELRAAGASEVVPETLEAGLMIATHALVLLNVPLDRVMRRLQDRREGRYRLLREFFFGERGGAQDSNADRLLPVALLPESPAVGSELREVNLDGVAITALVRQGQRQLAPPPTTRLEADDVVVLFGSPADLQRAERTLRG
jgi:CPA2 family monovalent cation:H+ antiporter-2